MLTISLSPGSAAIRAFSSPMIRSASAVPVPNTAPCDPSLIPTHPSSAFVMPWAQ
jgi:hypothetical protein